MTSKLVLFTIVLLLSNAGNLLAFEFGTGRGTGLGQTVILSRSSASALVSVPTGGIASGEMKLELGAARKFGMKDLDQAFVAVAYRYRRFTSSLGLAQFGYSDLYSERTAKAGVAWHGSSLTIGTTLSALLVSFGGHYDRLSAATFGAGASYRTSRVMGAVAADNLTSPRLDKNSPAVNPIYSAYLEVLGEGSFSIMGRVTLEKTERPQFALGQKTDISERGALFWGLSTAPLEYGGGVEVTVDNRHICYAASYHPTLGLSHSLSLSFEFGGSPRGKKEAP
jgi:hypothetical protein